MSVARRALTVLATATLAISFAGPTSGSPAADPLAWACAPDEIAEASIATIPWWRVSYGLWWTPWRTVCTVRSGHALRLRLRNGRTVTVTVPDPQAALGALRGAGVAG